MTGGQPPLGRSPEFKLRVASTLVLIPLVIGATALGGWLFAAMVAVIGAAVHVEWVSVTRPAPFAAAGPTAGPVAERAVAVVGIGGTVLAVLLAAVGQVPAAFAVVALAAIAAASFDRRDRGRALLAASGVLYAAVPAVMLVLLRATPGGVWPVVFVFALVWATDILAYVGGRTIGGPKLWPAVSPKKTWSGGLCGLAGGVAAGVAVAAFGGTPGVATAILAAVLSIVSQAGDFAESALKRRFDKKDSGNLIPGHGGVMDRVDGLLAAVVLLGLVDLAGLMPPELAGGVP